MEIGVVLPTCDLGSDPSAIRDYAHAAEELGYDHLLIYDHVLGAEHQGRDPARSGPYDEGDAYHEPFVLFGYLAGTTSDIGFATGVLVLPQRQTALVAKQAAELQLLSDGRLRLGVGTGWNYVEYEALGMPYRKRGRMLDEQTELLRRLLSEDLLDYQGEFHRIDRAGLLPRPKKKVPIWFGGFTDVAIRRTARIGDGFIFGHHGAAMLDLCRELFEQTEKQGRAREDVGVEVILPYSVGPDAWAKIAEEWKAAGATHLTMRTMDRGMEMLGDPPTGFRTVREHIDALEPFISAVR